MLEVEWIRSTRFGAVLSVMVHGSLARTSTNVISPAPATDHGDKFSISSSRRESRTFLCNQRYSAPSSYRATIGIVGAVRCAITVVRRSNPKQMKLRRVPQNKGVLGIELVRQTFGTRMIPQWFGSGRGEQTPRRAVDQFARKQMRMGSGRRTAARAGCSY